MRDLDQDPEARLEGLEREVGALRKEVASLHAVLLNLVDTGEVIASPSPGQRVEAQPTAARPAPPGPPPTVAAPPIVTPAPPGPPPTVAGPTIVTPAPLAPVASAAEPPAREWTPRTPAAAPPRPPRKTLRELADEWELTGPRGFAIVGGAVLALGIGFFFVLAANRGWIGEGARIALGAAASAIAVAVGLWLRTHYGQYWAALGAVGAGLAGAYATLAAATARYDLVPDALGLPLAGVIAAVGTVIAIRWHSEVVAAIALLGSALAPALQGIDTGLTWASVAFALVVLAAAAVVAIPRGWLELLHVTTALVGVQALWLVHDIGFGAGAGTIAVTAVLAALLLLISVGLQRASELDDLDPLALTYSLLALGVPIATASWLFDGRAERGVALLSISAVWVVVLFALVRLRKPDLAVVVGTSALALTALGTGLLLTDSALVLAWSVEAVVLAALTRRFADARLHATGIVYAAFAAVTAVASGFVGALFDDTADHLAAVLPLAAVGVALVVNGAVTRTEYARRTETGLLVVISYLRGGLETHRQGARETLVVAGTAFGTLSLASGLVAVSFEWGHVVSTALAAVVGAAILAIAGKLTSDGLAYAGYGWLTVVVIVASAFDVDRWYDDATGSSSGGWAVLAAAAALLGGAYANRLEWPASRSRDVVFGAAASTAAVLAALGAGIVTGSERPAGAGVLVAASAFTALAAYVFRRPERRTMATTLWSLALLLVVLAEGLLVSDAALRGAVIAATAFAVAALATPLHEERLWLAGSALAGATTVVVLLALFAPALADETDERWIAIATGMCAVSAFATAALRWGEDRCRDVTTGLWIAGLAALIGTERLVIVDERATIIAIALTGGVAALLAAPLRESRLWAAGAVVVGCALATSIALWTTPEHLLVATPTPADGLIVLAACLAGIAALAWSAVDPQLKTVTEIVAGGVALYGVSLGILGLAEVVSTASVETDFERGHTMVSGLWALVGLALLVVGLLRGSRAVRYGGLALFGLSLAKIFLYDLSSLSSVARAFSFILVGGMLLAGGFFLQRLSDRLGPPSTP